MRRSKPNLTMDAFAPGADSEHIGPIAVRDELARDLGYNSVRQMMEQTELVPLPTGAYTHLTTDSDGYWVAWNDHPFCFLQRFDTRQAALAELRECETHIWAQS